MTAITKPAKTARKKKGDYHHGDLRAALIAAGTRLLERHGAGQLSLRQVAQAAGVTPAAPYAHFPDRAALLAAIAAEGFVLFGAALQAAGGTTAGTRLEAMALAYVQFARAHPALFRLMFGPELTGMSAWPDLLEKAQASFAALQGAISGVQPGSAVQQEAAMTAAWSFVHGLAILVLDGKIAGGATEAEIQRRVKAATRIVSQGLHR